MSDETCAFIMHVLCFFLLFFGMSQGVMIVGNVCLFKFRLNAEYQDIVNSPDTFAVYVAEKLL